MSKNRYINTRFWSDNFVSDLNPLDRYLFLYFLTNEHTNIFGVYELPMRTIAFETGIEVDMLGKMMNTLKGKVNYIDGWVYIKNFAKHQSKNASISKGIENVKKTIPESIMAQISQIETGGIQAVYRRGTGCDLSKPKPKPKPKLKVGDGFEKFWESYPLKKSKKKAESLWMKIKEEDHDKIMTALEIQKKSNQWTKDKGQFIPHPTTWLNQERWNDETTDTVKQPLKARSGIYYD